MGPFRPWHTLDSTQGLIVNSEIALNTTRRAVIILKSAGDSVVKLEPLHTSDKNVKWCNHLGKQSGSFLKKFIGELPYHPAFHIPKRT